jgi:septal ring factor EnvC (AmiA/AmiB activator)
MMSKQEEIDLIRAFVADSVPRNSYLATLLAEIPAECEKLIRSDLAWPLSVAANHEARLAADAELESVQKKTREASRELAKLQVAIDRASSTLKELRDSARKIAATT